MLGDLDLGNLEMAEAGSRGRRLLHLRRGDQMEAAHQLRRLLPEADARSQVLQLVAVGTQVAHAVNPQGWGITLNAGNIRLNVGRVAVIRIDREWVRLTLDPSLLPEAFLPGKLPPLQQSFPRSLPGCAGVWFHYRECAAWVPVVQTALHAAVEAASRSMAALHHPFQRAHSPSVLNCLRLATTETLPEPGWRAHRGRIEVSADEAQVVYGRTETDRARFILERLLPEPEGRRACLEAFAASLLQAQEVAPNHWSVTLYPNKVWLNVGSVMVSSLHPGMLWRALDGASLEEPALRALGNRLDACGYSPIIGSTGLESAPEQVSEDCALTEAAHHALLLSAATHRALPRHGREDHSAGVLEYLHAELGLALPERPLAASRAERRRLPAVSHSQPPVVLPPPPVEAAAPEVEASFEGLRNRLREVALHVPSERLANYLLALQTKRFVLLCGITGTGKTRLAREVARYFHPMASGTEVVAVRPDWTDSRGLLGYHNPITGSYVSTPCLRLLLEATAEVQAAEREGRTPRPYFLILDEMNLARVEHYFSDFLSCLESGEPLHLHDQPELERGTQGVPQRLPIPPNLFLTGTVNVDETTFMFSAKVLDRAFAIEFNDVDLAGLVSLGERSEPEVGPLDLTAMRGALAPPASVTAEAARWLAQEHPALWETVTGLHTLLAARQRHFGYRVANEVARFVELAVTQTDRNEAALWAALDLALLQKVLPKFHGMQQELEPVLVDLEQFATRLPRFQTKVTRMLARLRAIGFTAYME